MNCFPRAQSLSVYYTDIPQDVRGVTNTLRTDPVTLAETNLDKEYSRNFIVFASLYCILKLTFFLNIAMHITLTLNFINTFVRLAFLSF